MHRILFVLLLTVLPARSQSFDFDKGKSKTSIRFKLINNLIFIPVTVNNVPLTFLLDTGVDDTILFSLDDNQELQLNNIEKVKLRGLGNAGSVDGLRSTENVVSIGRLHNKSHELYIVLNQEFNFSSHIGIVVNGIIGYQLFKDLVVNINYDSQKITFYKDANQIRGIRKNDFTPIPISIENNKPYVNGSVYQLKETDVKLLIDTGNSDAVWIFNKPEIVVPDIYVNDYLGRGFSGDIFGKRGRISDFTLSKFAFKDPITAFPDSVSIRSIKMVSNRAGSVGGEILKRFNVVFDYRNQSMFLEPSKHFNDEFTYNMSGMEVHHSGVQWVQEKVPLQTKITSASYDGLGDVIRKDFKYKFELKPVYAIAGIRENSPAALCGLLADDTILKFNGNPAHKYTLQEINSMLKSQEGKKIDLLIERKGKLMEVVFYLKKML